MGAAGVGGTGGPAELMGVGRVKGGTENEGKGRVLWGGRLGVG